MFKEEEIRQHVGAIEDVTLNEALRLLSQYNNCIAKYLAEVVAHVCNVDVKPMLMGTGNIDHVQARWLYWYAYRYLTNESYESMSNRTKEFREYAPSSIGSAVAGMSMMISDGVNIWSKRWSIVRRVINIIRAENELRQPDIFTTTVTIKYPKGVNVELIKE